MDLIEKFNEECQGRAKAMGANKKLLCAANDFMRESTEPKYSYNFSWMGRPIIQYPQDMIAMQELLWKIKPDIVVETGIAHGGSLIFYSSILELIGKGSVLGIDIDIRKHNREAIESHPMYKNISMIEGSSVSEEILSQVKDVVADKETVLVVLDSNHTHEHVTKELELYSPFVTNGSYLVVFDTIIEDLPEGFYPDRPWGRGDNPKTAVWGFLENNDKFEIDKGIDNKLLISVAPDGYLKRIK